MFSLHHRLSRRGLCLLLAVASSVGCQAAFDAYLKLEGIDGGSADSRHPGWIEVLSFSQNVAGPAALGGKSSFSPLCLLKPLDQASPLLSQRCASAAVIPSATLELITSEDDHLRFFQITLSNVVVGSISTSGGSGGAGSGTINSLCLSFGRIEWVYTEYDAAGLPKGDISAWWDLVLNVGDNSVKPVLRVVATPVDAGHLRLAWPAKAGRIYHIRGSSQVTGQYRIVGSASSPTDGALSQDLPVGPGTGFFTVEEAP